VPGFEFAAPTATTTGRHGSQQIQISVPYSLLVTSCNVALRNTLLCLFTNVLLWLSKSFKKSKWVQSQWKLSL